MEWDLPDQVKEADREQEEDEATAGKWEEAEHPGGECICPSCGAIGAHQAGVPCYQSKCPSFAVQSWRGSREAHFMVIYIASGKGGRGRTSTAVSLALSLGACER